MAMYQVQTNTTVSFSTANMCDHPASWKKKRWLRKRLRAVDVSEGMVYLWKRKPSPMKKVLLTLLLIAAANTVSAQFIMTVEMSEPVEGICDDKAVYALYNGFTGQVEPKCAVSDGKIEQALNEIPFLQANPKFKSKKGMIGFYVNCEGEMLACEMDNTTGNQELDRQMEEVFRTFGNWQPGTLNGMNVDTRVLYTFTVKGGRITLN